MTDEARRVQLLWSPDCPNVDTARARLEKAFDCLGLDPDFNSRNIEAPQTPSELRGYGSPTILVDGRDIAGHSPAPTDGDCCRVYGDGDEFDVAPDVDAIVDALRRAGLDD